MYPEGVDEQSSDERARDPAYAGEGRADRDVLRRPVWARDVMIAIIQTSSRPTDRSESVTELATSTHGLQAT